MTDTYRALCAELLADYDNCHYRSELSDRARAALAQPEPVAPPMPVPGDAEGLAEVFWGRYDQPEPVVLTRPDCFNLAMDFLGGTEEVEVRNYIERLEYAASAAQPEPVAPTDEEIEEWADASSEVPLEEMDPDIHGWRRCFTKEQFGASIREALACWGTPAIQPVPGVEGADE